MNSPMPKSMKLPDDKELFLRLAKARSSLALDHPFFGALAMGIPHVLANVPTAQTNGKRVQYGRKFLANLSAAEVKFLVAHECMHPMLGHPWRRGNRNPKKWNYAGDYVINGILTAEGIGKMIEGGLLNPEIVKQGGGTTDGIYAILPEDYDGGEGGEGGEGGDEPYNGTPTDECTDDEGTPAELKQAEDDWKVKVAQAAQAARTMGKMTAGVELLVEQILTPIVDWRDVLQRFLVRQRTDERTFARPNRRFASQGMYLPSTTGEVMGEVVFYIDCSGSVLSVIPRFAAEVKAVKEWLNPSKMHVVYFDSQVSHYACFGPDDELHVEPHGGGGTAFSPCFRYIEELGVEPVAAVFLTDLCCNDFGPAPSYPVLWVSICEGTAPFGEIIVMKETAR